MKKLLEILYKHQKGITFITLLFISFFLLIRNNSYHHYNFFSSANSLIGSLFEVKSSIVGFAQLKKENIGLAKENALLIQKVINKENKGANTIDTTRSYEVIPLEVVNQSIHLSKNYLTLNKGEEDGIKANMGIINSKGVIGIIKYTSKNFSIGYSLLNKQLKIAARNKRTKTLCLLEWDGKSTYTSVIKDIPAHEKIYLGDSIVTAGYGLIFPPNLLIGKVESVIEDLRDPFIKAKVKLENDFRKIRYVYAVENLKKSEKDSLEKIHALPLDKF